jgi:hypothetical protein
MATRKTPIAKTMTKRFANEKYRLACAEPYLWMCKANEVRRAADILWQQFIKELSAYTSGIHSLEPFFGELKTKRSNAMQKIIAPNDYQFIEPSDR